jgi:murein DD-endopeptidase MepM/ murein hydrolase activator NlpD
MRPDHCAIALHIVEPRDTLYTLAQRYGTTVQAIAAANPGIDPNNLYIGQEIIIWPGYRNPNPYDNRTSGGITQAELNLRNLMRILWEQHITWTRLTITSMVFNLPDVEPTTNRLLRNPKDFEAALAPLYGPAAAARFSELLREHLVLAAELVNAAKAGDSMRASEIERRWYDNARAIAALLARINPYWSQQQWENMLFEHLRLVKAEATGMLNKNYLAEINLYDEMERNAMMMADTLSEGIVRQFPDKFK